MSYRFLEDVAIADVAFEARGRSREEMFVSAAEATMNVMVGDLDSIEGRTRRPIAIEAEALDLLLFNFLQEFIYYKDAERLLLRPEAVRIWEEGGAFQLSAELVGEELDAGRHELIADVKAVTLHRFQVVESEEGLCAFVILDI